MYDTNFLLNLVPFLFITTIVGMILCYKIVKMVLSPREEGPKKPKLSRRERKQLKSVKTEVLDHTQVNTALDRAEELSHRVQVLEEILSEEKSETTRLSS